MLRALAPGILSLFLAALPGASRATTLNELKVGIRIVDFLSNPPHGRIALALIYDPQLKASVDDARSLIHWMANDRETARVELMPTLVDVHQLDDSAPFPIGFVAAGMETHYGQIFDYARQHRILTISADLSCVREAKCAVGVAGTPRVEVVISQQAALSCGIEFTEAFRMMVTEN